MPRKSRRPCPYPGCPNLTDSRFCDKHQRVENKRYEKYDRDPATRRRYGRAWKILGFHYSTISRELIRCGNEHESIYVQKDKI